MTLWLLLVPLAMLVLGTARFADSPGGGESEASGEDGGGEASSGGPESPDAEAGPSSAADLVRGAAQEMGLAAERSGSSTADGPAAQEKDAEPASPFEAPPASGAQAPKLGTAEVLAELEIDPQSIPTESPEAVADWLATWVQDWYANKYTPRAQQVRETIDQQQQWYEQLQGFVESDAYRIAAQLADDPQLFAAVHAYLQTGGQGAAGTNGYRAPQVNLEELDDQTRAIYESVRSENEQLLARNQQLEQRLAAVDGRVDELSSWAEKRDAASQETAREQAAFATRDAYDRVMQGVTHQLGFDPREYGEQFERAVTHAREMLGGRISEWMRNGKRGPAPSIEQLPELIWAGLRLAGFERVWNERRRQAASSAAPPPDRAGGGDASGEPHSARDLVTAAAPGVMASMGLRD